MSDLKDRLQTINGIGSATADDIIMALDEIDVSESDTESKPQGYMAKALEAAKAGDYRQAGIYLSRVEGEN